MMDLHAWITQQVDAVERSIEDDCVASDEAAPVLRRCEADHRILNRHRLDPAAADTPRAAACDGCGYEWVQDYCDPRTDNLNDCPELLDLAHAHGITPETLAGLDRPQVPEPELYARKIPVLVHACESGHHREHPGLACEEADAWIAHEEAVWKKHWGKQYAAALRTPMCDVPVTLRGPNWKARP